MILGCKRQAIYLYPDPDQEVQLDKYNTISKVHIASPFSRLKYHNIIIISVFCSFLQVVIIQACQGVTVASPSAPAVTQADASRGNPPLKEHSIVLTRPHTLLLMSTVARGLAKRGAFTGALAKQIANADGRTPIYHMIAEAKVDMDRTITDNQTSEVRDTLKRKLVLPAPTAEVCFLLNLHVF